MDEKGQERKVIDRCPKHEPGDLTGINIHSMLGYDLLDSMGSPFVYPLSIAHSHVRGVGW